MKNWRDPKADYDIVLAVEFDDTLHKIQTDEGGKAYLKFRVNGEKVDVFLVGGGMISFHLDDWPTFFHLAKAANKCIEFIKHN